VEVGKLKSALFRSGNGSRQRFYWLACLLLCALFGHAQTQVDINRQTRGVLQLNRGGTGQASWVGGRCVQVAPDGSKLEVASAACSVEGHGHTLAGDVTGTTSSTTVIRLQGRGVSSTAPSNGQSLVWNQTTNLWEPRDVTIDASQVVSGTLADARVAQSNVTQHQGALQLSASQITSGVLSLARGGTGQSAWSAGTCVQVSADGTRLESTSGPCGTGGGGVGGSGSAGSLARWVTGSTLGNSSLTESTSDVSSSKPIKAELRDRGGAVFNVKAYGAKGDNVADDTQAIQSAIDACPNGGMVFFPAGSYKITAPLSIVNKSIALVGSDYRYTDLVPTGSSAIVINSNDAVRIAHLNIYGEIGQTSGALISVTGPGHWGNTNSTFEDLSIRGGYNSIHLVKATSTLIRRVRFGGWNNAAILAEHDDPDTGYLTVRDCAFSFPNNATTSYGIYVKDAVGARITGNDFWAVALPIYYYRNVTVDSYMFEITSNTIDGALNGGIVVQHTGTGYVWSGTIANNRIYGNNLAENSSAIQVSGSVFDWTVSNNNIRCPWTRNAYGIKVEGYGVVTVTGNITIGCSTPIMENVSTASSVMASGNLMMWGGSPAATGKLLLSDATLDYTSLSGLAAANGSIVYCSNCTASAPCAGGGTGAIARRISGAWVCSEGGGGGSFDPLNDTVLWFREDFPNIGTSTHQIGTHGWAANCSGPISSVSKTGSSPFKKAYRMETGNTSSALCHIVLGSAGSSATVLGALGSYGSWDSIFSFRNSSAASTGMVLFVGYILGGNNTPGAGASTARIGVEYDTSRGDTNFMFVACNGSNCTRQSSGVSLDTSWHKLRIRSQTAGTILFSLDGGTEVSINTNVPTGALAPMFGIRTEETAAKRVEADRWYWSGPNAQ